MRLATSLIISISICLIFSSCATAPKVSPIDLSSYGTKSVPADLAAASANRPNLDILASGSKEALDQQRLISNRTRLPVTAKTKVTMIPFSLIPPGTFRMGSSGREKNRDNDENTHTVAITRPFYMGKHEITQAQWKRVMGTAPSKFGTKSGSAPVEMVTWNDCVAFCKALCVLEKVPAGSYRLPTEAEWEYACRAGTTTAFCYGKELDHTMAHFGQMPYVGNTSTVPVGQFPPNAWGLYDMHGNVYEWCGDWFGKYSDNDAENPKGPASGTERVSRGGGWGIQASYCRSANRCSDAKPNYKMFALGFRIVREIP